MRGETSINNIIIALNALVIRLKKEQASLSNKEIEEEFTKTIGNCFDALTSNKGKKEVYSALSLKWHPDKMNHIKLNNDLEPYLSYLKEKKLLECLFFILSSQQSKTHFFKFSLTINFLRKIFETINHMQKESDRYWSFFKLPIQFTAQNILIISSQISSLLIIALSGAAPVMFFGLAAGLIAGFFFNISSVNFHIKQILNRMTQGQYFKIIQSYEEDLSPFYSLACDTYINEQMEWHMLWNNKAPKSWDFDKERALEIIKYYKTTDLESYVQDRPDFDALKIKIKIMVDKEIEAEIKEKTTQGRLRIQLLLQAVYSTITQEYHMMSTKHKIASFSYRALLVGITPLMLFLIITAECLKPLNTLRLVRNYFFCIFSLSVVFLAVLNAPLYALDACRFLRDKITKFANRKPNEATEETRFTHHNTSHSTSLMYLMGPKVGPEEDEVFYECDIAPEDTYTPFTHHENPAENNYCIIS